MFLLGVSWGKWGGLLRSVSITAMLLFALAAFVPFQEEQITAAIRMNLGSNIIIILAGFLIGKVKWVKPGLIGISWLVLPILVMVLFSGFDDSEILPKVPTTSWGGLMVTFLLAFGGILLSFPIGVALALGRRSTLPVVSTFSTVFIETIRGVPLITILFMFSVILALFLPQESRLDRLLRALIALTVFSSAYMAENIRGGLQSIPSGQIEAAKAIGMTGFQTMSFIVLPQALRAVIPAIVGQFIGLFKDTTLVVIVGLNDFLGIGKSIISADPAFLLLQTEVYIFIAFVYWIFSYLMSLASRRVETALGVGYR
ncbi:MAG: amino acid ABC transporter permease [Anaerolineae bacterium]|nr:amino acid ABC transporter permease [Anaerolineae bacterium]